MLRIRRVKSKAGARKYIIIQNFSWCQSAYLQMFRGYKIISTNNVFGTQIPLIDNPRDGENLDYARFTVREEIQLLYKMYNKRIINLENITS